MITVNETYKDDFNSNGIEDKNYLRVLFNGGRSVQIREINQLQSILQSQIDKFGSSVWKTGTNVIGGNCTFDRKVQSISFLTADVIAGLTLEQTVQDVTLLIQGDIQGNVIDVTSDTGPGGLTVFYYNYNTADGTDNTGGVFDTSPSADITLSGTAISFNIEPANPVEIVGGAFLSEGVFFINGSFVVTPKQNAFISIPGGGLNDSVVLNVIESYVTYAEDETLLDNATGFPNHLAPGADRYQITLTLGFASAILDENANANLISLFDIKDTAVVVNTKTRYSDIDRQLAQRTFEESGNYVVNPFKIELADLLGSSRPGSADVDAVNRVYLGIEPSIAYVDGYRIELNRKLDLTAPRARRLVDQAEQTVNVSLNIGNYIDVEPVAGSNMPLPNTANLTYELKDGVTTIGSCRIKAIETVGSNFRLFLYDIDLTGSYNLTDADAIFYDNGSDDVSFTIVSALQDTDRDTAVFKLPYDNVKELADAPSDLSFVIKKLFTGTASGSEFTINASPGVFEDLSPSNFIVEDDGTLIPTASIDIDGASTTASITFESLSGATVPMKVIAPVRMSAGGTMGAKAVTVVSVGEVPAAPVAGVYTLTKSDLISIEEVLAGAVNLTSDFEIYFDGQTSSKYTNAQIRYIGAGTAPASIAVKYTYFAHTGSPFVANSYPIQFDESIALAPGFIWYKDVPSFNGVKLSDCIDFRPLILDGAGTLNVIQPDPNSSLTCKPTFYLPRVDKVVVNSNGEFNIIEGVPAVIPQVPLTPPASMTLYELQYPAYTFKASDIKVNFIDNRRYTMRDIGDLDKRISNIEYYTSLSLLEASANSKSIFDDVQGQRFKNGILVDAFAGHSVGDVTNPGYACAIDNAEQTLRPRFKTDAVDLIFDGDDSTVSLNENTITLPFSSVPLVSQLVSSESESVNPYDVASFVGNIKLYPSNDKWMETNRRPDVIINDTGAYDALALALEEAGALGTEWNSWKTNWTGVKTVTSKPHTVTGSDGRKRQTVTTTKSTGQSREGIKTTLTSTTAKQSLGDRVIDISFIPFIRSRKVYFEATGLKPNTLVYPFFDGISIAEYTQDDTVVRAADTVEVREYLNISAAEIPDAPLVSNANGTLTGSFIIPNNSELKFRAGERVFRLSDSVTNNIEEETTFAESDYIAAGTTKTVEETIISTRVPAIKRERVTDKRVISDSTVRWQDPLAQTFIINEIKEGVMLSSIDLWFTSKSSNLPVTVRIVAVENGYPTQRVLPFSEVSLIPDDVTIDDVGNTDPSDNKTTFAFSDPVYLKSGVEYAFVVLSNDPKYRLRVARLGGMGEDNKVVQSNPYGGVMFTSQNASTWTADQTRDIKFVLNRAEFNTALTGDATFNSLMRSGVQSITITNPGSSYEDAAISIAAPPAGTTATAEAIVDLVTGTVIGATITNPGSGYLTAPVVTITTISGATITATAVANLYTAKTSAFNLIQESSVQKECSLTNVLNADSVAYSNVEANENYLPLGEFTVSQAAPINLVSTLKTTSKYVSPVIDLDSMALLCIENEVNAVNTASTTEDTLDKGEAASRYITREVELNDPADQLNIYIDANRPAETANAFLYVKLKYDSSTYSDWILVDPLTKIAISSNETDYQEVQYIHDSSSNDFISFAVKIVFSSTSGTVDVVTLKRLRVIATS